MLIAQTEFNYAGSTVLHQYGAIHGIFQAVRILEAAYHTVNGSTPDRARARAQGTQSPAAQDGVRWSRYVSMHMHALAESTDVGWDGHVGVLQFNASLGPSARPKVSGVGQIFAHLTRAARPAPWSTFAEPPSSTGSDTSRLPSYFVPLVQAGASAPVVPFAVNKQTKLPCLQGSLFTDLPGSRSSPRFAIVNRCSQDLVAVLPAFQATEADAWVYDGREEGGWAALPGKGASVPWTSGPLFPEKASVECTTECRVTVPGVSIVISAGTQSGI